MFSMKGAGLSGLLEEKGAYLRPAAEDYGYGRGGRVDCGGRGAGQLA